MIHPRIRIGAGLPLLAGAVVPTLLAAQGLKVNAPLPPGIVGDVTVFQISPDSRRVVYSADQSEDGTFGLYSVPIDGGPVVVLDPRIAWTGTELRFDQGFEISSDSRTVVYRSAPAGGHLYGLYSVPILGGPPPIRLDEPFFQGSVGAFEFSSDDRRVVYLARQDLHAPAELFSVPVTGGARVRLNGALVAGGSVHSFRLSPDGRHVVYLADQETLRVRELYVVPIDGGVAVKLSVPLAVVGGVDHDYQIGSDSKSVVYRDAEYGARLFSVPLRGGPSTELAGASVELFQITANASRVVYVRDGGLQVVPLAGGPSLALSARLVEPEHVDEFEIAADSKRVVYHVERGRGPEGEEQVALYSVPLEGGPVTELARPADRYVSHLQISPDSRRVLYHLFDYAGVSEVWSAPIGGGPAIRLLSGELFFAEVRPDSSQLVHVVGRFEPGSSTYLVELFTIPLTGGTPTRLNGALVEQGWVQNQPAQALPRISPDGTRILYLADQEEDDVLELFSVPSGGGSATKLNPELVRGGPEGDVDYYVFSPDGAHVLYRADQDENDVLELYAVSLQGRAAPAAPVKLNGPLVHNGDVGLAAFRVSPDSRRAVYVADQDVEGIRELYSVEIGGGVPVKLNGEAGTGLGVHGFNISPDSSRVVFSNDVDEPGRPQLFSVALAGGMPVELTAAILELDFVNTTRISGDARRVVFTALHHDHAALELYSIPLAGGPLTILNPPPVAGGRVYSFEILPDSSGVVYYGDLETDEQVELYHVPITGGPSVKLNGALPALGDVVAIALSPDSRHVLYRADQERNGFDELYRVSPAGLGRIKLNLPLPTGGNVRSFKIAPDSSRVVYMGDQNANDVFELFSVPIEGGTAVRLNGPLVVNGDLEEAHDGYLISPASDRVVYLADQERNGTFELYSVPLGGGAVTKLNGPLGLGGSVQRGFAISSDARHAVFRANPDNYRVFELFVVPLAGGAPPERLNGPLTEFGSVTPTEVFAFQLAGQRVLYRADQDQYGVFELYLSFLPESPPWSRRR